MANEYTLRYRYLKIVVKQFATFEENYDSSEAVQVNNSVTFGFSFESSTLLCSEEITYIQKDKIVLKICVDSHFLIDEESIGNLVSENTFVCPRPVLCQFASLNYGSMRGIIFEKTQGSVLNDVILPPYVFDNMITSDLKFMPQKE